VQLFELNHSYIYTEKPGIAGPLLRKKKGVIGFRRELLYIALNSHYSELRGPVWISLFFFPCNSSFSGL
jgi:hypothetical protein